ncbi:MAG TPA: hypothetical protein VLJ37_02935 [bacterium]|nr:hypothetical protein [bacterium]
MRPYRLLFGLAAAYNAAFGVWAGFFPQSFFTLFRLEPINYPSLWACLGMVVGVYALAYAYAAWKPEEGDVLIWIGLIGKILGPLGWVKTVWAGGLPPRTFPLILCNDLVWWFPFLLYLLRNHKDRAKILTSLVVVVHVIACLGAIVARGGTEIEPSLGGRQQWVLGHIPLWSTVWMAWVLSSLSLLALFPLWARELESRLGGLIYAAVALDLAGELHHIVLATDPARTLAQFADAVSRYNLFSVVLANGLYCLLGLVFSALSWRRSFLKGGVGVWGFAMWTAGLGLSLAALLESRPGIIAGAGAVMALFLPWVGLVGWRFRGAPAGKKA